MAASGATECSGDLPDRSAGRVDDNEDAKLCETCYIDLSKRENDQGPHDWRKRLRPVQSPIKAKSMESLLSADTEENKENGTEKSYSSRPLPPWKRDLIERNKKVARLVRRESSGRSKRSTVVRRESSGKSKKAAGSESPSSTPRKRSFKNGSSTTDNAFTQQVVNETSGRGRRISPHNSFKNSSILRRIPSDKVLDPNDPNTKKRLERVRRSRLYLLQQMGPNSFLIVGDSPEHKFKVIIGPQTCTCGKGPHCIHALFVMLRVFQVNETDLCLWSKKLKNYEVENLFRVYNAKRTLRIEAKNLRKNHKSSSNFSSRAPSPVMPCGSDAGSVREEDDSCPICLLEMLEGESLLKCDGCQNRLHHHCITVWFEECKRQNDTLECPLCRAKWKPSSAEVKTVDTAADTPLVPPNTRAPSPQHDSDTLRLPYAEPIPGEYINMSTSWVEILGEDLVACLFSRNWSIRETGLKHAGKEITTELLRVTGESRSGAGGMSLSNTDTMVKILKCCFHVVSFMCQDPVYKVFVGCLKMLRAVFAVVPSRDYHQRSKLQTMFRPVIDAIIVKCTDGTKRTSQLSLSTMMEFAKAQHGELALGRELPNPGVLGLGGMTFLVSCITTKEADVTWQWLLGRLYVIEKLIVQFPTEFLPRQRPDGASSESSLDFDLTGPRSNEEFELPQNYERLLTVADFALNAVSNSHSRISRVARRVFLLAARYAAHLENLIEEFNTLLNELGFTHKKSLKRQLDKIVSEFQLSQQIGRELNGCNLIDKDLSPSDSGNVTPTSTPKCTSPVTVLSDNQSDSASTAGKTHQIVPPNTPIRDRTSRHLFYESASRSFDQLEEEAVAAAAKSHHSTLQASKSLDDLDSIDCKPRSRLSKSPVQRKVMKSRSRSSTPKRVGPVLETNLDEVIQIEEESRKISRSRHSSNGKSNLSDIVFTTEDDNNDEVEDDMSLELENFNLEDRMPVSCSRPSPLPRLLSHDLETDIDSIEPDLDSLLKRKYTSTPEDSNNLNTPNSSNVSLPSNPKSSSTPKFKLSNVPRSLSLDLKFDDSIQKRKLSISPTAHLKVFERRSCGVGSAASNTVSQTKPALATHSNNFSLTPTDSGHSLKQYIPMNSKERLSRKLALLPNQKVEKHHTANQKAMLTDDLMEYMATTPTSNNEKPVTFETEVAMATPKHSPSHTLDRDDDDCLCKEEVEREEALALAKAMEVSSRDPPKPIVPGLTPMDTEQVITIRIQPDDCDEVDCNGNPPTLYYENIHWVKGPLLGTGAFSTCYQARDVRTGTIMALKQISFCRNSKSEQDNVIETITEEITMMSKLNHPHTVRIMGATRQGCHFNMFVEWMPGGSVSYLLGQYGAFSEDTITNYVLQILRGLAYLHENQILHRDLKGANLLIDSTGQRLRIGDFGAAARLASKGTGAGEFQGQLLGTIAFMAPEVLRGETYGRACDVWSVGCCVIEMATTKPPWNAHDISNHLALIFKIANSHSTPPVPEKLSPPVRDLLLRCLEPTKEQRPTAKELLIHPLFTQYMQTK